MRRLPLVLAFAALATPAALHAQRGLDDPYHWFAGRLKIKGHHIFDRSTFAIEDGSIPNPKVGWGLGLEYVLMSGIGFGVVGYTAGPVSDFDSNRATVIVLAEANYFIGIEALKLAPYLGLHTGIGTWQKGNSRVPRLRDNLGEFGYQVGVRFQPWVYLGLDAQLRWMSDAAYRDQTAAFERTQVLLGITIL
ncbi:MAG TPA: hypothetical protein VIL18_05040 [Longimicrobiales bacterium]